MCRFVFPFKTKNLLSGDYTHFFNLDNTLLRLFHHTCVKNVFRLILTTWEGKTWVHEKAKIDMSKNCRKNDEK